MENIRNFVIIAHIDHGKSTLADRFLELTSTVAKDKMRPQFLDMMDLEREKGITIKMQPVRMEYQGCILNLIDTPGHVDFSYEVSRSLAAVEGAILLVDATQGIQAQTISNLEFAKSQNLVIIPAVNKIDMMQARVKETKEELSSLLGVPVEDIFEISAKQGLNVKELLEAVTKKVPGPKTDEEKPLRALIFDSKFDSFKGVVAFVRVTEGKISSGEKIYLIQNESEGQAKEVGYFKPQLEAVRELKAGEIGYIATGIKEPEKVRVGDTITKIRNSRPTSPASPPAIARSEGDWRTGELAGGRANFKIQIEALPGYKEPKPMVFASIYPENAEDFELFKNALAKLKLSDAALEYEPELKEGLGRGYRCGFLGTLHAEIVSERLYREFGLDLIISTPSVVYKIINQKNKEIFIYSATEWPSQTEIKEMQEPWVRLEIITPLNYLGPVSEITKNLEGNYLKTEYVGKERLKLVYEVPLRKIIVGFYDNLKSQSQGFCSMNYEVLGYRRADLVKVDILVAGKKEEVFSKVVAQKDAFFESQKIVSKLKEVLPSQLFSVPLQAAIGGKIIARETIKAKRRDVIAPLYGGDYTRKKKLLEKQKEGKKKLAGRGQLRIPAKSYLEIFKSL